MINAHPDTDTLKTVINELCDRADIDVMPPMESKNMLAQHAQTAMRQEINSLRTHITTLLTTIPDTHEHRVTLLESFPADTLTLLLIAHKRPSLTMEEIRDICPENTLAIIHQFFISGMAESADDAFTLTDAGRAFAAELETLNS